SSANLPASQPTAMMAHNAAKAARMLLRATLPVAAGLSLCHGRRGRDGRWPGVGASRCRGRELGWPGVRAARRARGGRAREEGRMGGMAHFTIATVAEQSADFRRVLWTGKHTQLVIMTIPPGGEIGEEVHEDTDQILTFVSGTGEVE